MTKPPYNLGFKSQEKEQPTTLLNVKGNLPEWLKGSLVRTAPSVFEIGKNNYRHWFDGLAMLHKFDVKDGKVNYSSKFLESNAYKTAREKNKVVYGEFGTDPCRDFFQKVFTFFKGPLATDNGSVNIIKYGNHITSNTETVTPIAFDPKTLETTGHIQFDDELEGNVTIVHPHIDDEGYLYSYMTQFSKNSNYIIYKLAPNNGLKREQIASVPTKEPAYMHSFGMTENFIILTEFPLVVKPLVMRFSLKTFIEKFNWNEALGTKIHLVHKKTGEVSTFETGSFFSFHHVNAFEEDEDVVFDLVGYEDAAVVEGLYLDKLKSTEDVIQAGNLWRFRLSPKNETISKEVISKVPLDLPRTNYERTNTKPYQYVYGAAVNKPGNFFDSIVKIDVNNGRDTLWYEENMFPGEPVFVEKPNATAEDDGLLLSIVLDSKNESSFMLVLNASTMEEVARAYVPQHITFGFHGQFFSSENSF